ncbi:MAG: NADH-quinone oxidoreductase subunit NuoG [Lysobacterales bacterium]
MSAQPKDGQAPDLVNIEIDGQAVSGRKGAMIIELADNAGIHIPRFCYHKKLSIAANCRMCLVDVEKAPKPMPACATPIMEGMKVYTQSKRALDAQRNVMEFLLINHPLDCPICDQGGECELQDVAMGYGRSVSRFSERKRVVADENLGPLVATDMTRCIHCTRCVRFLHEVAGTTEMGGMGRGEHTEIGTFIGRSLASEVQGNIIDVCPVGALTNKVFRFRARAWELTAKPAIGVHDALGGNLWLHLRRGEVLRVVPRENEGVNEVWASDRDRYSHTALTHADRLSQPFRREGDKLVPCDWETALGHVVEWLDGLREAQAGEHLGVLAGGGASCEEYWLLQALTRGIGAVHLDHRLRQLDFTDQASRGLYPQLGTTLEALAHSPAILLVGANPRHDQPLLGHRVRQAWLHGTQLSLVSSAQFQPHYELAWKAIVAPTDMAATLAGLLGAALARSGASAPADLAALLQAHPAQDNHTAWLDHFAEGGHILLGDFATRHPQASLLRRLAQELAGATGATWGEVPDAANAAGASAMGLLPHRLPGGADAPAKGLDAAAMLRSPRRNYLLYGAEAPQDFALGKIAVDALRQAHVVAFAAYDHPTLHECADIVLPIGLPAEVDGSYLNALGQLQAQVGAAKLPGEARPGWRILRALGGRLEVPGFDFVELGAVSSQVAAVLTDAAVQAKPGPVNTTSGGGEGLEAAVYTPIYEVDAVVRRAEALQHTVLAGQQQLLVHPEDALALGVGQHGQTKLPNGETVAVGTDAGVARGTVLVPSPVAGRLSGLVTGTRIRLGATTTASEQG